MRLYFFDDARLRSVSGFTPVPGPVEKLGPVGGTETPDPRWSFDPFSGSLLPLGGGAWRAYVTAFGRSRIEESRPCVFESPDGLRWERGRILQLGNLPQDFAGWMKQPSVVRLGDGSLRMYLWLHGTRGKQTICRLCTAASGDGQSFAIEDFDKPVLYHPSELGPRGWETGWVPTADQFDPRWRSGSADELRRLKRTRSNDSTYVYREADTGRFIIYGVTFLPNPPGSPRREERDNVPSMVRVIARRESADGYEFSDPEIILMPDAGDPLDQQFYYLAVHRQDDWHIGLLGDFEAVDQTQDLNIVVSRDGHSWTRPTRSPFIPRVEAEPDGMNVYAINSLIDAGDDWLLIYRGGYRPHNDAEIRSDISSTMRMARFGKRRFVGLDTAGNRDARLVTGGFVLTCPEITLDAEIRGKLRAELCDAFGNPVPGFRREDFLPVTGDSRRHVLRWNGKSAAPYQFDPVSLRIEATDSTLYALEV